MMDKLCREPDLVAHDVVLLAITWLGMVHLFTEVKCLECVSDIGGKGCPGI